MACIFQWRASSNCPRSSWASKLDARPLSFFLSFHKLITLVHLLHGNPYSLTSISIDGHLHSPLIRLVDVRLSSPFFVFSTTTILFHIQCYIHGWHSCIAWRLKKFENIKSTKQLLGLSSGLCIIWIFCVMKMQHSHTIWFCRDKLSLAMLFWEEIIALLVCLKYYCFYINIKLFFESYGSEHTCHNKRNYIEKYAR